MCSKNPAYVFLHFGSWWRSYKTKVSELLKGTSELSYLKIWFENLLSVRSSQNKTSFFTSGTDKAKLLRLTCGALSSAEVSVILQTTENGFLFENEVYGVKRQKWKKLIVISHIIVTFRIWVKMSKKAKW